MQAIYTHTYISIQQQQQNMPSSVAVQDGNFAGFPVPQPPPPPQQQIQLQMHPQMQAHPQQQQQQPSPRAGRAVTPQSPQLLSPGHTMMSSLRSPHISQQHVMQGAPSNNIMMQQQQQQQPQQLLAMISAPFANAVVGQQSAQSMSVIGAPGGANVTGQQAQNNMPLPAQSPVPQPQLQQNLMVVMQNFSQQTMQQQQQPSPSPVMQQPIRPGLQQQQQQLQQRPMPAPSPMMATGMQHSPMPGAMTPIPSPGLPAVPTSQHLQQQQQHSLSPMAQHSPHTSMMPSPRMGTPLSHHSKDAASPFSPGPMSSPQPGLNVMRLLFTGWILTLDIAAVPGHLLQLLFALSLLHPAVDLFLVHEAKQDVLGASAAAGERGLRQVIDLLQW